MANKTEAPSSLHQREVFYVGGQYVTDDAGRHTLQGQMYVEKLTPIEPDKNPKRSFPIIFIHGATRSGAVRSFRHFYFLLNYLLYIMHAC
ncbi:hypothetical protein K445DRAFT_323482 [Daldinia sp. EC12]|nr:hypothetical protein K445DRAFT_323482 [Daldinia sp. EC12]